MSLRCLRGSGQSSGVWGNSTGERGSSQRSLDAAREKRWASPRSTGQAGWVRAKKFKQNIPQKEENKEQSTGTTLTLSAGRT